jgi:dTDP-4-dehydrorhamnose reductase
MRILVTGAVGRLGRKLVQVFSQHHDVTGIDIQELDITDFQATKAFITQLSPDLVIHPAAWTDVDGCAREPQRAIVVNGFGAQHVALGAAAVSAAIVYVSTNEVFDGQRETPYYEYDTPNPVNPYGYSKWVGEQAVQRVNPKHYIVRTSWLFAHGGVNFIQKVLEVARIGKPLKIVTDEVANPTYNDDLVDAIQALIETERYGIYHLVNEGACSRYDFARYFLDKAGFQNTPIESILLSDWPRASMPPKFSPLCNLAGKQISIILRHWQEAVDVFLEKEGFLTHDEAKR